MQRTDGQLLEAAADGSSEAFAEFYKWHVRSLMAFFVWQTGDGELAADLASEVFAAALAGLRAYRREAQPASSAYA